MMGRRKDGGMEMEPIRTERDHERALREIESLWGAKKGTPEAERLDALATLVDTYECEHFPIDASDRK
jgi:HTH-type transcriptional regulator/antitoxin HigA